jgi:predicted MPP superfamily phosphohydrolase/endonuclease/exonuclease/phosphatase family metal-dependent hydrolase
MLSKFQKTLALFVLFSAVSLCCANASRAAAAQELKVFQINTWQAAKVVPDGAGLLVDTINSIDPDVVLLCELDDGPLMQQLVDELAKRGKTYYQDGQNIQTGILSKYKLEKISILTPTTESFADQVKKHQTVTKAYITVGGRKTAIYSAHLDWAKYAPYLPRGYGHANPRTKLDKPVTDVLQITLLNRESTRDESAKYLASDMAKERDSGNAVIFGGDLNEPSHLDWQQDTKDIREHNGVVINWDVSLMLAQAGLADTYRQLYPNAVTHPGFTWPSANNVAKGFSAKEADERDRIDFIYYSPQDGVELKSINIVGPAESFYHGKTTPDKKTDALLKQPTERWFSDHKGNLAVFQIAPASSPRPAPPVKMTFAFLTDVHFDMNKSSYNGLLQAMDRAKESGAEIILFGGDTMNVSAMGHDLTKEQTEEIHTKFKNTMDAAGVPCYPAIGNHDRYYDKNEGYNGGDEMFKKYFGHSYYSFERKGVRFFFINSVQTTEKGVYSVSDEQLAWLKNELAGIPLATPIVMITHVPIYTIYYPVVKGEASPKDVVANFKEVLAAFREHNLKLVLQGHQHLYEELFSQNVQYITGGAVCAGWWRGAYYGTEEGFLLIDVNENNKFTWTYIDYGWSPQK